jgi:small subunit ribosomal protein S9
MKIINTSGKRKRAVARASLRPGTGKVKINKVLLDNYTPEFAKMKLLELTELVGEALNKVDVNVNVRGGGIVGQVDAARVAISRGLVEYSKDEKLQEKILQYDRQMLVSDVRRKETRKPNDSKARAKRQKSYR